MLELIQLANFSQMYIQHLKSNQVIEPTEIWSRLQLRQLLSPSTGNTGVFYYYYQSHAKRNVTMTIYVS